MHCRSQGGAVCSDQLVTMSELQCHAAVTSSRGHEARSAAETSQGQLPPSGRGSKKVAAQDCVQVQYAVCMVSVHHRSPADNSRHRQSRWCNVWRAGHEQQPTWTLRTPTRPLLPPRCRVANILPQQYQFINICYLNHKETSE